MPSVIYVAIGLPGFIRCPADANPPVSLVRWKKDGLPLRIDKVSWRVVSAQFTTEHDVFGSGFFFHILSSGSYFHSNQLFYRNASLFLNGPPLSSSSPQYPGWSQMEDGSIRVAEVTEDSMGTYTCMPYNTLGSMGWSTPAPLVLKVLLPLV